MYPSKKLKIDGFLLFSTIVTCLNFNEISIACFRSFLYLFFMVVLAGTCDRDALFNNYMIAERVSALGFLLLSALYISSISSCLATLYGTPRVLQSIASENVIPGLGRLSEGVSTLNRRLLYTFNPVSLCTQFDLNHAFFSF